LQPSHHKTKSENKKTKTIPHENARAREQSERDRRFEQSLYKYGRRKWRNNDIEKQATSRNKHYSRAVLEREWFHISRSKVFPLVVQKKRQHETTISVGACFNNRIRSVYVLWDRWFKVRKDEIEIVDG